MTKQLTIKNSDLRQYSIDKPAEMVAMATVLKDYIVKQKLFTNIQGKNYAHVEGWQFAGFLTNMYPVVRSVEKLSEGNEIKWLAIVEILREEKVIGRGIAVCSNKENKKKSFDEYAILSMAQTRAIGKAYRNLLGWVMKLAQYEATPAEEMSKVGETYVEEPVRATVSSSVTGKEKQKLRCQKCANEVTEQVANYSQKIYGKILCRDHQPKKK